MLSVSKQEDGAELYIDYQDGVGLTIIAPDKSQINFSFEPHEWDVLLAFLDKQKAAEQRLQADAALAANGQAQAETPRR